MLSNEVQRLTGLTRKAMEYYEAQGLVSPCRDESGYRHYSEEEVACLQEIDMYRRLDLSIHDIKRLMSASNKNAIMSEILRSQEIKHRLNERKRQLLSSLLGGASPDTIREGLRSIGAQASIFDRLCAAFPGFLGQSLFINYQPYLQGRIETDEQEQAYMQYLSFLDQMPALVLTQEEQRFMEASSESITEDMLMDIARGKMEAVEAPEEWLTENKEALAAYERMKESSEWQNSPMASINQKLRATMEASKYYEVAIPLLRRMSPAYDAYYRKLLASEEVFMKALGKG